MPAWGWQALRKHARQPWHAPRECARTCWPGDDKRYSNSSPKKSALLRRRKERCRNKKGGTSTSLQYMEDVMKSLSAATVPATSPQCDDDREPSPQKPSQDNRCWNTEKVEQDNLCAQLALVPMRQCRKSVRIHRNDARTPSLTVLTEPIKALGVPMGSPAGRSAEPRRPLGTLTWK